MQRICSNAAKRNKVELNTNMVRHSAKKTKRSEDADAVVGNVQNKTSEKPVQAVADEDEDSGPDIADYDIDTVQLVTQAEGDDEGDEVKEVDSRGEGHEEDDVDDNIDGHDEGDDDLDERVVTEDEQKVDDDDEVSTQEARRHVVDLHTY